MVSFYGYVAYVLAFFCWYGWKDGKMKKVAYLIVFVSILSTFCTRVNGKAVRSYLLIPTTGGYYEAQEIPMPTIGDRNSIPNAINNQGQVVGKATEGTSWLYTEPENSHMYLYDNGISQYIGNGFPKSINEQGQIVGQNWPNNFIYENGQMTQLDLGYEKLFVTGINNNGTIIGYSDGQSLLPTGCFYYKDGVRTDFNVGQRGYATAINDNEIIVGKFEDDAFVYQNNSIDLITSNGGEARDINNNNQVVGHTYVNGIYQPYLWENDILTLLGTLGGKGRAYGLNNNGSVVGYSEIIEGDLHAFLYQDNIILDLNDLISNKAEMLSIYGEWYLNCAFDINDRGMIIAQAIVPESDPILEVAVDIKPRACPNPVNVKSKGYLSVAILGTDTLDVNDIDISSIRLEGVAPVRSSFEDVATPTTDPAECACTTEGPDGYEDLVLKFETQEILAILGEVNDGDEFILTITGLLRDNTEIEGSDCIVILKKSKE
jgi:probable HAF family extracellular repeat protein